MIASVSLPAGRLGESSFVTAGHAQERGRPREGPAHHLFVFRERLENVQHLGDQRVADHVALMEADDTDIAAE